VYEKRQLELGRSRSYKLKLRPGIEDDDNHYTLTIRQFEYSSSGKDPKRWCSPKTAMDGLFNSLGVHEDSPEERKNLFYSNLGPSAQSDWQRMTEKRFIPSQIHWQRVRL
jgi:hypothetical protein